MAHEDGTLAGPEINQVGSTLGKGGGPERGQGPALRGVRGDVGGGRGHFPGEPIFPGVLLVEAAAQLAGIVAQSDPNIPPLKNLKLAALRNVKIIGTARPGEVLTLTASLSGRMAHLVQAQATASVRGAVVLKAELTLSGRL